MTFSHAVIIGSGTMGHGIAHVTALAGIRTTLYDLNDDLLKAATEKIEANLEKGVQRNKITPEAKKDTLARLSTSSSLDSLGDADLMIEAIPERMELKKELFAAADERMPEGAILASNTSSLSITEIASATKRPEAVCGLHFFNPVHIMKLLEIVKGPQTSDATIQRALSLAEAINKTSIVVNDAPGFATSRLGICLGNEAMRMVEEGVASPADIDTALKLGYGHPMGPLALSDLVGLDVRLHITSFLHDEIGTDGFRAPRILRQLVRAGHIGKKCGRGFYLWEDGKIVGPNPMLRQ